MTTISAIIITKNEEKDIAACIESVLWTDEIIVLDSGSADNTQNICAKYAPKVQFHKTDWPGFGAQKQRALTHANSDWILSLDADERITAALQREILMAISSSDYIAYNIPRLTYFMGKPIKYCFGKNDAPIRLIKKGCGNFSNDIVHERIIVTGKAKKLRHKLHHFSSQNIEELLDKMNTYSTLGAEKLKNAGEKASFFEAFSRGIWAFIKMYFLKCGFLDGFPGFILAFNSFEGTFYRYAKLAEKIYSTHG